MLTPAVARRLTLQQTLDHPWVSNRLRARQMLSLQYCLTSRERALILIKLSIMLKNTVQAIEAHIRQDRLGEVRRSDLDHDLGRGCDRDLDLGRIGLQVAAMYNILAHKQLSSYHASWGMRRVCNVNRFDSLRVHPRTAPVAPPRPPPTALPASPPRQGEWRRPAPHTALARPTGPWPPS